MIRFSFDENVDVSVAKGLRLRGVDVITVNNLGMIGRTDVEQLQRAKEENRVLVTHDQDFLRLHDKGYEHSGIIYCQLQKYSIGKMIMSLIELTRLFHEDDFLIK